MPLCNRTEGLSGIPPSASGLEDHSGVTEGAGCALSPTVLRESELARPQDLGAKLSGDIEGVGGELLKPQASFKPSFVCICFATSFLVSVYPTFKAGFLPAQGQKNKGYVEGNLGLPDTCAGGLRLRSGVRVVCGGCGGERAGAAVGLC